MYGEDGEDTCYPSILQKDMAYDSNPGCFAGFTPQSGTHKHPIRTTLSEDGETLKQSQPRFACLADDVLLPQEAQEAQEDIAISQPTKASAKESSKKVFGPTMVGVEAGEPVIDSSKGFPPYSISHVNLHHSVDDLWIIIDGDVFDVTVFQHEHPGGHKSKFAPSLTKIEGLKMYEDNQHSRYGS